MSSILKASAMIQNDLLFLHEKMDGFTGLNCISSTLRVSKYYVSK